MKSTVFNLKFLIILFLTGIHLSSCLSYKDIVNFQDGYDLGDGKIDSIRNMATVRLKPDDIIMVVVTGFNEEEAGKFNLADMRVMNRAGANGAGVSEPLGYRVDSEGNIDMPGLGTLKVRDLTIEQVKNLVYRKIEESQYLQDFAVEVRYLTFRITIMGEVSSPGIYMVNNTKISILEAVGLAGDMTLFSNRDNILVIREVEGIRSYGRLNLKSKSIFESPYYYMHPNDILYVEPHKSRVYTTPDPLTRYTGTIISFISLILLVVSLF